MRRHGLIAGTMIAVAGCGVAPTAPAGVPAPTTGGYAIAALPGDTTLSERSQTAARTAVIGYGPAAQRYLTVANASPVSSGSVSLTAGQAQAHDRPHRDLPRAYMKEVASHLARHRRPARYWVQAIAEPLAVGTVMDFNVDAGVYPDYQNQVVSARLVASSPHAYFFVDLAADDAAMRERVARYSAVFEAGLYTSLTRVFGPAPDPGVDNQAPIFFLITPAADRVLGYFHMRDQFAPGPEAPPVLVDSNLKDMLYISSRHALHDPEVDVLGTITHELQHLIHFHQKYAKTGTVEETWLNEGLSTLAEDLGGFGMRHGASVPYGWIASFQANPSEVSLTDWDHNVGNADYGAVLLFMSYMVDRFGQGIITELATNDGVGVANVEAALRKRGTSFQDFFYDWAMANVLDGKPGVRAWRYQYRHFEMTGRTGPFTLAGFETPPFDAEGSAFELRPTTMRFYHLPIGQPLPDQLPFVQIW